MQAVKMYTTAVCPYCIRAKALLKQRGVEQIEEIRVDLDPARLCDPKRPSACPTPKAPAAPGTDDYRCFLLDPGLTTKSVVTGINVGGQPYWNAEATMLLHTRGILIMTPGSSMVLTGKQSLDFSGGVSADEFKKLNAALTRLERFWTDHRDSDPMNRNCSIMRAARGGNVVICHYFPDMVRTAVDEARKALANIPYLRAA